MGDTTSGIRLHETGGPGVLRWEELPLAAPARGEVLVRHTAIGLNYIDTYKRSGLYKLALPAGLGEEAAGVVEHVGRGVRGVRPGDRVAYLDPGGPGTYVQRRIVPAARLMRLPRAVGDELAAAVLLKGLTAWALLHEVHRVRPGEAILVPAASGGVGQLLVQWARKLGARVIGAVGDEAKAPLAKRAGCHVVLVGYDDLAARVRAATRGQGVHVAYDGVGRDTFTGSLDSLRPRGLMVTFGNASGAPPAIAPLELMRRGSLSLVRPTLRDYTSEPADLARGAKSLFAALARGTIRVRIGQRYPLADAARAHADLEARRTVGSTVLLP
jgi:NADPH2:quinone reductase